MRTSSRASCARTVPHGRGHRSTRCRTSSRRGCRAGGASPRSTSTTTSSTSCSRQGRPTGPSSGRSRTCTSRSSTATGRGSVSGSSTGCRTTASRSTSRSTTRWSTASRRPCGWWRASQRRRAHAFPRRSSPLTSGRAGRPRRRACSPRSRRIPRTHCTRPPRSGTSASASSARRCTACWHAVPPSSGRSPAPTCRSTPRSARHDRSRRWHCGSPRCGPSRTRSAARSTTSPPRSLMRASRPTSPTSVAGRRSRSSSCARCRCARPAIRPRRPTLPRSSCPSANRAPPPPSACGR